MGFVSNDKTSRDYVDNFYDPYDQAPVQSSRQKESHLGYTFTARSENRTRFDQLMADLNYLEWNSTKHSTNSNRDADLRPPFRMGLRPPFVPYKISMQPIGIFCIFSTLLIFSYN